MTTPDDRLENHPSQQPAHGEADLPALSGLTLGAVWNDKRDLSLKRTKKAGVEIALFERAGQDQIIRIHLEPLGGSELGPKLLRELSELTLSSGIAPDRLVSRINQIVSADLDSKVNATISYAFKDPSEIRDTATGLRTKAAVLDDRFVQSLNLRFPEGVVLTYFDLNHMKLANQFGCSVEGDQVISAIPEIGREVFAELTDYELIRLGGDEFLAFTPMSRAPLSLIGEFTDQLNEVRNTLFPSTDARVKRAERVAALREEEKHLRETFWESAPLESELVGFRDWLVENHIPGEKHKSTLNDMSFRPEQIQFLAAMLKLLRREDPVTRHVLPRMPILSATSASILIAEELDTEKLLGAMATLGKRVSAAKRSFGSENILVQFNSKEDRPSREQLHEYQVFTHEAQRSRENMLKLERTLDLPSKALQIKQLRALEAIDPAVPSLMRYGLIRARKSSEIFSIEKPTEITVLFFDIRGFAALNNVLGSDTGDQAVRTIAEIAQKRVPQCVGVRVGGGGVLMALSGQLEPSELLKITSACAVEMDHYLDREFNCDVRVLAEYLEKQTIDGYALSQRRSLDKLIEESIETLRKENEERVQVPDEEGRIEEAIPERSVRIPKKLCIEIDVVKVLVDPDKSGEDFLQRLSFLQGKRDRGSLGSNTRKRAA